MAYPIRFFMAAMTILTVAPQWARAQDETAEQVGTPAAVIATPNEVGTIDECTIFSDSGRKVFVATLKAHTRNSRIVMEFNDGKNFRQIIVTQRRAPQEVGNNFGLTYIAPDENVKATEGIVIQNDAHGFRAAGEITGTIRGWKIHTDANAVWVRAEALCQQAKPGAEVEKDDLFAQADTVMAIGDSFGKSWGKKKHGMLHGRQTSLTHSVKPHP